MKKKFFVPLMGALVLGVTAYAGYRTYDAYVEKETESNLLLENAEALASPSEGGYGTQGVANGGTCWVFVNGVQKEGRKIQCYDSQTDTYCTPGICSITLD